MVYPNVSLIKSNIDLDCPYKIVSTYNLKD